MAVSYCIVQSQCYELLHLIATCAEFVNPCWFEESAPFATFESAVEVILFESQEHAADRDTIIGKLRVEMQKLWRSNIRADLLVSSDQAIRWTFQNERRSVLDRSNE